MAEAESYIGSAVTIVGDNHFGPACTDSEDGVNGGTEPRTY